MSDLKFTNRVFGCVIVKSITSNYNADFSHQPRTLPDGTVYATDKALKYTVRNFWNDFYPDERVFFFKSFNDKLQPRSLDERYLQLFEKFKTSITSNKYCVFEFDGNTVTGIIPDKPKSAVITKLFKEIEEENDLKLFKNIFTTIAKNGKEAQTSEINLPIDENLEENYFFYLDTNNKPIKIEGSLSDIQSINSMVTEAMGGGINRIEHLKDLLTCIDIRTFGATYAGKTNISIHGTCQITHGKNKFIEGSKITSQIMSPFRNPTDKSKDSNQTTLGSQTDLQEGHYVHHFSVNPKNIEDYVSRCESSGLTSADVEKLKEGLCKGATYLDSSRKIGVENEFLLWVQLNINSKIVLPSFVDMVVVNEKREIDLEKIKKLLAQPYIKVEVEKIELFYNKITTTVINEPDDVNFLSL